MGAFAGVATAAIGAEEVSHGFARCVERKEECVFAALLLVVLLLLLLAVVVVVVVDGLSGA